MESKKSKIQKFPGGLVITRGWEWGIAQMLLTCVYSRILFYACSVVKNCPANAGEAGGRGLTPGSGRSPGGGNGHHLQYSCLGNSKDREAWKIPVHGITLSWT